MGLRIRLERTTVYNLHVDGAHTYAVGTSGVLVHNACGVPWGQAYHVYAIIDKSGDIVKFGYSGAKKGYRVVGGVAQSERAARQARKIGGTSRVLHTFKTKADALAAERRLVEYWTRRWPNSLSGNKNLRWTP